MGASTMTTAIVASAILILGSVAAVLRPVRKPIAVPVRERR